VDAYGPATFNKTWYVEFGQNGLDNTVFNTSPSSVITTNTSNGPYPWLTRLFLAPSTNPCIDVAIPFYSRKLARLTHQQFVGYNGVAQTYTPSVNGTSVPVVQFGVAKGAGISELYNIARPIADDASMSLWLGVPPTVLYSTT